MRHKYLVTWVKRNPLVVSPSKGFKVELGTLVLFEANVGAGAGLNKTNECAHKHTKDAALTCLTYFFY